jgi:Ca2+:H+ antiporter
VELILDAEIAVDIHSDCNCLGIASERHLLVFTVAAIAILPLAGWMGNATEQLADRSGEGVGGLLNATFGNAAE